MGIVLSVLGEDNLALNKQGDYENILLQVNI